MTINISGSASDELLRQEKDKPHCPDPEDALDIVYKVPSLFGQGCWRDIQLRQGLTVRIGNFRYGDRIITPYPETEVDSLEYHFHVSGEHQGRKVAIGAGEFYLRGSGLAPKATFDWEQCEKVGSGWVEVAGNCLIMIIKLNQPLSSPPLSRDRSDALRMEINQATTQGAVI